MTRRNETLNFHESTRAVVITSLLWSCGEILKSYVLVVRLSLFSRNILSFTVSHYLPMQSLTMLLIMTTIDTMMVHTITTDYYYYHLFPLPIRLILGYRLLLLPPLPSTYPLDSRRQLDLSRARAVESSRHLNRKSY